MKSWFIYNGYFLATCIALLLSAGCTEELSRSQGGGATGKMVTVSLKVSLPPALSPATKSADSIPALPGSHPHASFPVSLEEVQPEPPTKASDGTTALYNLWLFQFNSDGSINGHPKQLTDGVTPVNDMVTLDAPLAVATDQTLYLVVLGPKLDYDFSTITSLDDLKAVSLNYLTEDGGRWEPAITSDNEMPFAGSVSGVTVLDIDGGTQGLVEYNQPSGFIGGIEIKRLMAKVSLRYQFEVNDYTLQGMKLLNVNKRIRLDNPALNTVDDEYVTLERETGLAPDADGYTTFTWYVAQNCWGTVSGITTESQRYYKVDGTTVSGQAPALGTQIEAWAYSNSNTEQYAIYQMYVGNNNTDNFDVEANHFYNLRTTINTEIGSAQNDQRIRTYAAQQYTEFHASALISGVQDAYNKPDVGFDFDAHPDSRQITVQAQGRTVNVGVYTDQACTSPATYADSWLRLSPSSNYTEAVNNARQPLAFSLSANAVLPTRLKFYLYSDEYIYDSAGNIPDPGTDGKAGKRSLYLKVTTATTGDGGTVDVTQVYRIDQRPAVYSGLFGGGKSNGSYTKGLVHDRIAEYKTNYTSDNLIKSLPAGYYGLDITSYGAYDMDYGKEVTRKLAENPSDLLKYTHFPNPPLKSGGQVLLYQYTYYDTFAARYCYDRNRDENGNGRIDDEEFKWYLPASKQLLGAGLTTADIFVETWSTTAYDATSQFITLTSRVGLGSQGRSSGYDLKCVRDVDPLSPVKPYVETYDDAGVKYAAINTDGMPRKTEDRAANSNFYVDANLYTYTSTGTGSTQMTDASGNPIIVKRVKRHTTGDNSTSVDYNISKRFIISPTNVYSDGTTGTSGGGTATMNWATANGYLATANTNSYTTAGSSATPRGCSQYKGKSGTDAAGTWRVPTHKEGALIAICIKELEDTAIDTGFKSLSSTATTRYWLATESNYTNQAWYMLFPVASKPYQYKMNDNQDKTAAIYLRCIRDIPDTP